LPGDWPRHCFKIGSGAEGVLTIKDSDPGGVILVKFAKGVGQCLGHGPVYRIAGFRAIQNDGGDRVFFFYVDRHTGFHG